MPETTDVLNSELDDSEILIQVRDDIPGAQLQASSEAVFRGSRRNLEAAGQLAKVAAETVGKALLEAGPTRWRPGCRGNVVGVASAVCE